MQMGTYGAHATTLLSNDSLPDKSIEIIQYKIGWIIELLLL